MTVPWQHRPGVDPAPGSCDGGRFVECCTNDTGLTNCQLTTLGAFTPGSGLLLANAIPDDNERGSIEKLKDAWDNLPNPLDLAEHLKSVPNPLDVVEKLKPDLTLPNIDVDVNVPPVPPLAIGLLGLVAGAGVAYLWKGKK